jgi:ATP-dependent Clp endopeptidase proteolytic subunit ClpP
MDTSSKGGIPSQQSRVGRGDPSIGDGAAKPQVSQIPARPKTIPARPSTGRLTSLAQERRVALRGRITRLIASRCITRLVVLASEGERHPIVIHIDSPGGSVTEAMSILSTMNGIHCPVLTYCHGEVAGAAVLIASNGLRGYRIAAPTSRFSLGLTDSKDARRTAIGFETLLPVLTEILVKNTRQSHDQVLGWLTKGRSFGPQEAVRMGLIDVIATAPIYPKPVFP